MLSSDFCPLKWGDTADSERVNAGMRGAIFEMKNISRVDHKTPLDGRSVFVVVAKNATGGVLNARQCVILKSTDAGFSIEDDTTTGEIPDGIVDPHLASAGVADGDCCLVIVGGPCEYITDGAGALAFNDVLVTSTAGKVVKQTAAPANTTAAMVQVNSVAGKCEETVAATDGLTFKGVFCGKLTAFGL